MPRLSWLAKLPVAVPLTFREATAEDLGGASSLVALVYGVFVAPLYPEEGNRVFADYASESAWRERHERGHRTWLATDGAAIVGVAHVRDGNHVSMLFVHPDYQRGGVGRRLIALLERSTSATVLTVNASPNAVPAYREIGFVETGPEQVHSGIRFTPMQKACGTSAALGSTDD